MYTNKQKAKWARENGLNKGNGNGNNGYSPEVPTQSAPKEQDLDFETARLMLEDYGIDLGGISSLSLSDGFEALLFPFKGTTIEQLCRGIDRKGYRSTQVDSIAARLPNKPGIDFVFGPTNTNCIVRGVEKLEIIIVYIPPITLVSGHNGDSKSHTIIATGEHLLESYSIENPDIELIYDSSLQPPSILSEKLKSALRVYSQHKLDL